MQYKERDNDLLITIIIILIVISSFFAYSSFSKLSELYKTKKDNTSLKELNEELVTENRNLRAEIERLNSELEINNTPLNNIEEINYEKLVNLMNIEQRFIMVVTQDNCSYCDLYLPRLNNVLSINSLKAYKINRMSLTDEEKILFDSLFNLSNTPTTVFVENGVESSVSNRLVGNVTEEKIIKRLTELNYIN